MTIFFYLEKSISFDIKTFSYLVGTLHRERKKGFPALQVSRDLVFTLSIQQQLDLHQNFHCSFW